jgi:hypothetical protein
VLTEPVVNKPRFIPYTTPNSNHSGNLAGPHGSYIEGTPA